MSIKYLDKEFIESFSRNKLIKIYGTNANKIQKVDIERVVEEFGYNIQYVNLSKDKSILGRSIFYDTVIEVFKEDRTKKDLIFVNKGTILLDTEAIGTNEGRFAFTLAHELGHLLLHGYYFGKNTGCVVAESTESYNDDNDSRSLEWQADYFAGCILAPKPVLKKAFYSYHNEGVSTKEIKTQLAEDFGLSSQAMEIRLCNLGLM